MNAKIAGGLFAAAVVLLAAPALAQGKNEPPPMTPEQKAEMDAYMKAGTPGAQHQMLASTAGSYDIKVMSWETPGTPPTTDTGTATRAMALDGRVLVEDLSSQMMGMPYTGHGMTGYDNVTGKYWSTWNDSMSTAIVMSEGTCDAKKVCTFRGSWADPIKKTPIKARMVTKWINPTTETFEMFLPDKKTGKEFKMMEITYTKK